MPAAMTLLNPLEEESEDNLSLDLQVLDSEENKDAPSTKDAGEDEIPMEVEDEILDKFASADLDKDPDDVSLENEKMTEETSEAVPELITEPEKCDEPKVDTKEADAADAKDSVDDKDFEAKLDDRGKDTKEEGGNKGETDITSAEEADKNVKEDLGSNQDGNDGDELLQIMEEKTTEADETDCDNANEDEENNDNANEDEDNNDTDDSNRTEKSSSTSSSEHTSDDGRSDSEDIGIPLEREPTLEEEEDDNVDSTMDIEEEMLDNPIIESSSENLDGSREDLNVTVIENLAAPSDDNAATETEDNAVSGDMPVSGNVEEGVPESDDKKAPESDEAMAAPETEDSSESVDDPDALPSVDDIKCEETEIILGGGDTSKDKANKDMEVCDGEMSVLESILTRDNDIIDPKSPESTGKSTKRQLTDLDENEDCTKKIKLEDIKDVKKENIVKLPDTSTQKLGTFKKFMLDKSLKGLTRDQLEMLCIQKMCECIVQKSEIGDLKLKIKMHEQLLDCLRKEAVLLSKQTKDLNIVHQKVVQDIAKFQENPDKQLVVPKITRSVGLQAVVRDDAKRKSLPTTATNANASNANTPKPATAAAVRSRPSPVTKNATPTKTAQPARFVPPQTTPTTPITRVTGAKVVTTNATTPNTTTTNTTTTAAPKPVETSAAKSGLVIDLTDEDERKIVSKTTPNGTKVNMINAPNGHKFVVMPKGQTVMVKLAPTSNGMMVAQPVIRAVSQTTPNGVRAAPPTPVFRTVTQPMRAVLASPVRTRAPTPNSSKKVTVYTSPMQQKLVRHPAPLPNSPVVRVDPSKKPVPPKPQLMLNKTQCGTGIVLSWKMPYELDKYENIASYQLYAYQETKSEPKTDSWGKIGDVKALELPIAVTLTQFAVGNRYYFAVRAVDVLSRHGAFSDYQTILL